jgi:flagellar motor switch protein FliG
MPAERFGGPRKAAALFVALGEDAASQLLKFLSEEEIEAISKEISLLDSVSPELAEKLLEEFHKSAVTGQVASTGGIEFTKKLLRKALGPEASRGMIDRVTKSLDVPVGFGALDASDPQQLYNFIQNEHPQTVALILAHADPAYAATLLAAFPDSVRAEIAMRLANLGEISPEVIKRISSILTQKISTLETGSRETVGGAKAVAELVNKMDRAAGRTILEQIESENSELAVQIRSLMLVFDDIMLIDGPGMRELLQRADKKVLTLALKGTSEELQAHIFKGMSQRASEMMREDTEALGAVRLRDVEKAQHEIVELIQKLEEEGLITVRAGAGDEYVV